MYTSFTFQIQAQHILHDLTKASMDILLILSHTLFRQ